MVRTGAFLIAAFWTWTAAPAVQPASRPPEAAKEPPTIDGALALITKAYRSGPIGERVLVRVSPADGKEKRATFLLSADRGQGERAAQAKLEFLPQLTVHATATRLIAVNRFERKGMWEAQPKPDAKEGVAALLEQELRPIPSPHLALIFGDDANLSAPLPQCTGVTWDSVDPSVDSAKAALTLKGHAAAGTVTLVVDRQSGRLRRLTADLKTPIAMKLEVSCGVIDPGDPKKWAIATDGRKPVASLADLVQRRESAAVGDSLKDASLMVVGVTDAGADLASWPVDALVKPEGGKAPAGVILILFRAEPEAGVTQPELAKALEAAQRAVKDPDLAAAGGLRLACVAVAGGLGFDLSNLGDWLKAWASLRDKNAPDADPRLLLTSARAMTVESKGQPARVAAIVIGPDLAVRGVVPFDDRPETPADLAAEIIKAAAGPK